MVDIDHFKRVNDTHGHGVGDRVLKAVGRLLRQRLRTSDVAGRVGGEEFAIGLPDSGLKSALAVFDELRVQLSRLRFHVDAGELSVTISGGVTLVAPGESIDAALARADAALYEAKRAGRNRVIAGGS